MAQSLPRHEESLLQPPLPETDIVGQELALCEEIAALLQRQREALLSRDETAVWHTSEAIVEGMDRLQAAERDRRDREAAGEGPTPQEQRELKHACERLRLEGAVNQEIVADMLAFLDFGLRRLLPETADSYDPHHRPDREHATGLRLDQEA